MSRSNSSISSIGLEILIALGRLEAEIANTPLPEAWKTWALRARQEDLDYGPRYSPAEWFGDGSPMPERFRVRYLREVHNLIGAGLIVSASLSGRLQRLKLSPAGRVALDEITTAAAPATDAAPPPVAEPPQPAAVPSADPADSIPTVTP